MGKFMTLYTELGSVKYFKVSFSHGRVIFFADWWTCFIIYLTLMLSLDLGTVNKIDLHYGPRCIVNNAKLLIMH